MERRHDPQAYRSMLATMQRPPISLADRTSVQRLFRDMPLRVGRDMIDLVVLTAGDDRQAWRVAFLDDQPLREAQHDRARTLAGFWRRLADDIDDLGHVAVSLCRLGHPEPTGEDYAWFDAVRATATMAGLRSHGIFLCTPADIVELSVRAA